MVEILPVFAKIAKGLPALKLHLNQAGMDMKPEAFVQKTFISSFYLAFGVVIFLFFMLLRLETSLLFLVPLFLVLIFGLFTYMLKIPQARGIQKAKEIDKEIVYAGRFIQIELESGVPLYNALATAAKSYKHIGAHLQEIVDKIELGTPIETALNETIEFTPSEKFRKVLWQIVNSLKTGAEVSKSLEATLDQISKEQLIEIKAYGHKLNPIAMFYMIVAIIVPSLGMAMLVILSTFLGFNLTFPLLMTISAFIAFIQFMFIAIIKMSRPAVEI